MAANAFSRFLPHVKRFLIWHIRSVTNCAATRLSTVRAASGQFHLLAAVADVAGHAAQVGTAAGAALWVAGDDQGGRGTSAARAGMAPTRSLLLVRDRTLAPVGGRRLAERKRGVARVLVGAF